MAYLLPARMLHANRRIKEWAKELFLASCDACIEVLRRHRAIASTATSTTMRPDFWLARTHDDRYSLTPCSPLGKREYPDIQLGVSLGSFRMLTSDEAEFLVEAFGLHFKVKHLDYSSAGPQTQYEPVEVIDTRYVPDPDPLPPQPSRLFKSKTDQSKLIARSLCNVKRKRRTYQALSHLLQPL